MLVRIANRDDQDQTASEKQPDLAQPGCLGIFVGQLVFKIWNIFYSYGLTPSCMPAKMVLQEKDCIAVIKLFVIF